MHHQNLCLVIQGLICSYSNILADFLSAHFISKKNCKLTNLTLFNPELPRDRGSEDAWRIHVAYQKVFYKCLLSYKKKAISNSHFKVLSKRYRFFFQYILTRFSIKSIISSQFPNLNVVYNSCKRI